MQYLVVPKEGKPFLTNWFDYPDRYIDGSTVFNLTNWTFTTNGIDWEETIEDHL
jgi:hypothetical protein